MQSQIHINENCLEAQLLKQIHAINPSQIGIITDKPVAKFYANRVCKYIESQGIKAHLIVVVDGEDSKSRITKHKIEDILLSKGFGRDSLLVGIGGGVVTDLTGFVASTYMRGIPVIYLPTTLLAMVDAAIGGKTGVNTLQGKNLIGSFYLPSAVISDVATLATLSDTDYRYAFAEIIKHALVYDADYFEQIAQHCQPLLAKDKSILIDIIKKSVAIKETITKQDNREHGIRAILNFGHTLGHAIERETNYQINHGQAVALGLLLESHLSHQLGLLSEVDIKRIHQVLKQFGFNLALPQSLTSQVLLNAMQWDKKNLQQQIHCILLKQIGSAYTSKGKYTHAIDKAAFIEAIEWLKQGSPN